MSALTQARPEQNRSAQTQSEQTQTDPTQPETKAVLRRIRAGRRRRAARYRLVCLGLVAAVALTFLAQLMLGDTWYSPAEVAAVLTGHTVPGASFVVGELRAPRAVIGLLVGLAFGVSGRASQTMLRNPLASPDIIGITSGATTAAVFAILVLGWSGTAVSAVAVVAGLLTAAVIVLLSGSGQAQGGRLILIGIGISAMLASLTAYLQLRANVYDVADAMRWLSGSLSASRWDEVPVLASALLICLLLLALLAPGLRVLPLGEAAATGLGARTAWVRGGLLVVIVTLSAFATAAAGPIAFVSFLSGPIAARLMGSADRSGLVPAALMGALIVLAADLAGQYLFASTLPVGVVTGIVGAPYLLLQLTRLNRQGSSS